MRRACAVVVLSIISAVALADDGQPKGRLCWIANGRPAEFNEACVRTSGKRVEIEGSDAARRFVWLRENGAEVVAGAVKPGEKVIDLKPRSHSELSLTLSSSDEQAFPLPVSVTIRATDRSVYEFTVPSLAVSALRRVFVPAGTYELDFVAQRHRLTHRRANASSERVASLGAIVLQRFPRISGRIRQKNGTPIVGAEIQSPANELLASAGPDGRFAGYVTDDWPALVKASASGFGTEVVSMPKIAADTDMGDVVLSTAGRVRATVRCDACELTLALQRVVDRRTLETVATQPWDPVEQAVVFKDVAAGEYILLAKGDEPLQRMTAKVTVKEAEDADVAMDIEPARLVATVLLGGAPVADTDLDLSHTAGQWRSLLRTDARGVATTELWQQGDFAVFVTPPQASAPFFVLKKLSGYGDIQWTVELPRRQVVGRITDADGKTPIANASIFLETRTSDGTAQARGTSDASGQFEFTFVEPGKQTMTVSAPRFVNTVRHFELGEKAGVHREDIAMEAAATARVLVVDHRGIPVSGCTVVDTSLTKNLVQTDEAGMAEIPLRHGETKVVHFVPRSGSFAAVPLTGAKRSSEPPTRVTIPPGDAVIVVRSETTAGGPVPTVHLMLRVNGQLLPPPVQDQIRLLQGTQFQTGADGVVVLRNMPSGLYELWPHFSEKEAWDIMNGLGPEPPVRMTVRAGQNTATLTFATESTGSP